MYVPPQYQNENGGMNGGRATTGAPAGLVGGMTGRKWYSMSVTLVVLLALLEMLAGVAVGILAEQWLFSTAALRGQAVGVLVAFIGLVGLVGAVSHNAEVLRFSIAGGILALLFCGQMMNDVGHDIKAECGLAALERRIENVQAALTGTTEPELFSQIMSRMHELENGISSLDSKSEDSIKSRQRAQYISKARKRDEDYLLEKLETVQAHVHHLLDDPITLYVEDVINSDKIEKIENTDEVVTNLQDAINATLSDIVSDDAGCDDEGCEDKTDSGTASKRVRKSDSGEPCVFPVIYRGEVYHDCIDINNIPKCRSAEGKWMTCAPLEDANDEYLDAIKIMDPGELQILEKHVTQLLTIANFLDNLGELHALSAGDLGYMITILKDAHMSYEGSSLAALLVKERSEYSGGQTGKHELLKHLAEELVEEEGNSEAILDRFKDNTYELPESLEEKADKKLKTKSAKKNAERRKKRRKDFHKKFDKFVAKMEAVGGRIGLSDMPEHCLGSRHFNDSFGKITFALLIVQFMYTYAALSTIFEVEPPKHVDGFLDYLNLS